MLGFYRRLKTSCTHNSMQTEYLLRRCVSSTLSLPDFHATTASGGEACNSDIKHMLMGRMGSKSVNLEYSTCVCRPYRMELVVV
jgi:hypothetical protein